MGENDINKKHTILLRNALNSILSLINLPLIEYNDIELHYLPQRMREIYILTESFELKHSMFNIYNNNNILYIIGSLIYFELQATTQEFILWKILTQSDLIKDKITNEILINDINPYFNLHLNPDPAQNNKGKEEMHAIHALVMAKKMCLENFEKNCNIIKNAFLLEMTLETNALNAIFNAVKRKMINYNFINENLYL